jgi:hypothetical protein
MKIDITKKKPTILVNMVIDESGSMQSQQMQVISGFNEYIQDHKRKTDAEYLITLVKFSNEPEVVFANKPIQQVREITTRDYRPGGWTALRDAIGNTILTSDAALTAFKDAKVLTFIFTDGWENASKEYDTKKINKMIRQREDSQDWTFTFIGASADCLKQAQEYGISLGNAIIYNSMNMSGTISALSNATSVYTTSAALRGSGLTSSFFKDAGIESTADMDSLGAQVQQSRIIPTVDEIKADFTLIQPGNIQTDKS